MEFLHFPASFKTVSFSFLLFLFPASASSYEECSMSALGQFRQPLAFPHPLPLICPIIINFLALYKFRYRALFL